MNRQALVRSVVEESNLVGNVHTDRVTNERLAAFNIPDDERVIVLATERGEVLLIKGEGERLDEHFVELESVHHLECIKVPNDNISLEAHMGLLTRGDILASVADLDD